VNRNSALRQGVWALLLFCAACAGIERGYPDRRYFVLDVPTQANPTNPGGSEVLRVSTIRVSPRYADRSFVYRTSESGFESDFYHQFLVPPAALMTEEIRKNLIASEMFKYVIDASSPMQASFALDGSVNALYGDFRNLDSPRTVLEMEFFVTSEIPTKPGIMMQKRYQKSIPISGRSPEALVKGWNEALAEILTALVADLKTVTAKSS
jgi:cholesterol transport system auxiliary component